MLIPLTRKKFEELLPLVGTAEQYRYCWGKLSDFLRRLLISVLGGVSVAIVQSFVGEGFGTIMFILGVAAGLYWLWYPVYQASRRNAECRKYEYGGFWQGRVLDVFITEELIGTEETVNNRGDLVLVENRERRLNMEIGDESGFATKIQVPLQRAHRVIRSGDTAEMVVMSNRPDLSRISKFTDIFLSDYNLWVSDYPYLRRDSFIDVSRRLSRQGGGQMVGEEESRDWEVREPRGDREYRDERGDREPRSSREPKSNREPRSNRESRGDREGRSRRGSRPARGSEEI